MTTITTPSALLEQALEALDVSRRFVYQDSRPQVDAAFDALSAALAAPATEPEPAEQQDDGSNVVWKATNIYGETAHFGVHSAAKAWARSGTVAPVKIRDLRLVPTPDVPCKTCEALSRAVLLDQVSDDRRIAPEQPAWHDAPEAIALKAERDELLKLINRRKIHPHDFPLEIFIADLSTRTANVLRAEFDSFRHTAGACDIEPPFTVRHLLMFSRQEIKKWPGIGKKGLNEIEENLRARGLQLWHAHDDRSLRLLREHKSYFVDPAKAKGVAA